jgi:hypothetical protein
MGHPLSPLPAPPPYRETAGQVKWFQEWRSKIRPEERVETVGSYSSSLKGPCGIPQSFGGWSACTRISGETAGPIRQRSLLARGSPIARSLYVG